MAPLLTRDRPILPGHAALLIIDVQNGTVNDQEAERRPEFHRTATQHTVPNIRRLLSAFRAAKLEVIYTVIENLTADGRDRSLDYKLSNFFYAKGSWDAQVLPEIVPQGDEIGTCRKPHPPSSTPPSSTTCSAISASRMFSSAAFSRTNASITR